MKIHLEDVMVFVLTSSSLDCGFYPKLNQIKDYKIDVWCINKWDSDIQIQFQSTYKHHLL